MSIERRTAWAVRSSVGRHGSWVVFKAREEEFDILWVLQENGELVRELIFAEAVQQWLGGEKKLAPHKGKRSVQRQ